MAHLLGMKPPGSPFHCFGGMFFRAATDSTRQFPEFKAAFCSMTCPVLAPAPKAADIPAVLLIRPKKKRRRRRKKRKNRSKINADNATQADDDNAKQIEIRTECERQNWRRRRHLSTTSDDSFICFESDLAAIETEEEYDEVDCHFVSDKKVHFAEELCQVHEMEKWGMEYAAARKGPWEEYARDRERFSRRITDVENQIGWIFDKAHRDKILRDRNED